MSTVRGGTTPICITYRKVNQKPVVKRTKRFVGWRQVARNVIGAVAEFFDSVAYEAKEELESVGEVAAVHWAVEVEDPWGVNSLSGLVAVRVPERPPAGVHFEIIKLDPNLRPAASEKVGDERPMVAASAVNGEQQAEIRARFRDALLKRGHFDPEAGPPPP